MKMINRYAHYVALGIVSLGVINSWASPGDLDLGFGNGGKVFLNANSLVFPTDGSVQTDDTALGVTKPLDIVFQQEKIMVYGGYFRTDIKNGVGLVRLLRNGQLDRSFGENGRLRTFGQINFTGAFDQFLVQQPDGKLIIVVSNEYPYPPAIDEEGYGSGFAFVIGRLLPDGQLDLSFGDNGSVTVDSPEGHDSGGIRDIALQSDGKIVLVGGAEHRGKNHNPRIFLGRFLPSGKIDGTFGTNGYVFTDVVRNWPGFDLGLSARLQSDERIVVSAQTSVNGPMAPATIRLLPDGRFDPTFNKGGSIVFSLPNNWQATVPAATPKSNLVLAPNGRAVVGASLQWEDTIVGDHDVVMLAKLRPNGRPDSRFGSSGVAYSEYPNAFSSLNAMVMQDDGKIIIAGDIEFSSRVEPIGQGTGRHFYVARYLPNGQLDKNFGTQGYVITRFKAHETAKALAMGIDPAGKLVVAGDCSSRDDSQNRTQFGLCVARYVINDKDGCGGQTPTIVGTEADDVLRGTPGPDVIAGLAGNDKLFGLGGDDILCGGEGNDILRGGSGDDKLYGGPGDDKLLGNGGKDKLLGENGTDETIGAGGQDRCEGETRISCER